MEIIPIGTGDAFAKTLNQTNFMVRPADGAPFLVDFGHTATRALASLGVPLRDVGRVVLSHLHADHVGGLEELGFTGYFGWGERPELFVPHNLQPWLWNHALCAGMGQRLRGADGAFFDAKIETYFRVSPVFAREVFSLGSVRVTPFPTPHVPGRPCWGFRLEDVSTAGVALLTCDSRFHPRNLEAYGVEATVIFHDCQLSTDGSHIHATLDELLTLPERWQQRIRLVHYADDWADYQDRTGHMTFAVQGQPYRV